MPGSREQQIETALNELLERAQAAQTLLPRPDDRAGLEEAAHRARAGLAAAQPGAFLIALAGGTGAGKSTLINALAGTAIADTGERRPTTSQLTVYHHHELARGGLPPWLAANARFITHDREPLRDKVLIDTPDLDSFVREHRELTRELLKAAGLVLYVLSAEKYLNADIVEVLREERRFSGCAVVLNKIDRLGGAAEIEQIAADIRERLAAFGVGGAPLFKVCARWHEPGNAAAPRFSDDFDRLTHFIEQELEASEIERLRRRRQTEVFAFLSEQVDRVAPPDLTARLEEFAAQSRSLAAEAAGGLLSQLSDRLTAIDWELAPLAVMSWHQRFWGPLRAWLALSDFTRFGLAALARRFILHSPGRARSEDGWLLGPGVESMIGGIFEDLARRQQDLLYRAGLPVGPWRKRLALETPELRTSELDGAIRARYLAAAAGMGRLRRWLAGATIHGVSAAGAVVSLGLVGWGLFGAIAQTLHGRYDGLGVLGHVATLIVLVFVLLQVAADLMFVPRRRGRAIAGQAIAASVARWNEGWVKAYRGELEEEWRGLREPLAAIRPLLNPAAAAEPPAYRTDS